ncbi:MAG: hypothetical protein WBG23_07970, partial [Acidobacteriaceae bacterium]
EKYLATKGELPPRLTFALASLITFYRGTEVRDGALIGNRGDEQYRIQDEQSILETFAQLWSRFDGSSEGACRLTESVLQQEDWWGKDLRQLPGLSLAVSGYVESILNRGMRLSLQHVS